MRFCPSLSRREYDLFRAFVFKSLRMHHISRVIKQVSGTVCMLQGVNLLAIRTLQHQAEGRLFMEMGSMLLPVRNAKPSEPFLGDSSSPSPVHERHS
jgi:hypothetical protein